MASISLSVGGTYQKTFVIRVGQLSEVDERRIIHTNSAVNNVLYVLQMVSN